MNDQTQRQFTAGAPVHVSAYSRVQGGLVINVSPYDRSAPAGGGGRASSDDPLRWRERQLTLSELSRLTFSEQNKLKLVFPERTPGDTQDANGEKPYITDYDNFLNYRYQALADKDGGNVGECVSAVKRAIPEIGRAADWKEGKKIVGKNNPPLKRGTALATFVDGKYKGHALIFESYGTEKGVPGMNVLDQWKGHVLDTRFVKFYPLNPPINNAGAYSIIKRP